MSEITFFTTDINFAIFTLINYKHIFTKYFTCIMPILCDIYYNCKNYQYYNAELSYLMNKILLLKYCEFNET